MSDRMGLTEIQMQRWIELQIALENFRSHVNEARQRSAFERQTQVKYAAVALCDDPPGLFSE